MWQIKQLAVTASTNDDAKRAAEAGEPEGLVIWALRQTAGRGRHGRTWESPEGNLYCSVLLRPNVKPENIGQYSFVAALALYDTIKEVLPNAAVTLKWPNDVLVNGKKIGGILLEAGDGWLVVGTGVNVMHFPPDAVFPSTSLLVEKYKHNASGKPEEKDDHTELEIPHILENLMLGHFEYWYKTIRKLGFSLIRMVWMERAHQGPMRVRLPSGEVHGDFAGLDENGALRLRLANGSEKTVTTGDVFPA